MMPDRTNFESSERRSILFAFFAEVLAQRATLLSVGISEVEFVSHLFSDKSDRALLTLAIGVCRRLDGQGAFIMESKELLSRLILLQMKYLTCWLIEIGEYLYVVLQNVFTTSVLKRMQWPALRRAVRLQKGFVIVLR